MSESKQRPRRPPMRRGGFNDMPNSNTNRRPPMRSGGRPESQSASTGQPQPAQPQQPPQTAASSSVPQPQFPLGVPFYSPAGQAQQFVLSQVPLQFPGQPVGGQPIQPQTGPTTSSSGAPSGAVAPTTDNSQVAAGQGGGGPPSRRPPIVQQQPRPQFTMTQAQFQQMQQTGQIAMIPQQLLAMQPQAMTQPIVPMAGTQAAPAAPVNATAVAAVQPAAPATEQPPPATEPATNATAPPAAAESPKRRGQPWGNKQRPLLYGWARIRQVLSGQSLQIECRKFFKRSPDANIHMPSRIVTLLLDCIQCPTIGRRTKNPETNEFKFDPEDEPFAFEAKEFTRKSLLEATRFYADPVIFAAWNLTTGKNQKVPRYFGDVYLMSKDGSPPRSLSLMIVEAGWGEVKQFRGGRVPGNLDEDEFKNLQEAQAAAQSANRGKYQQVNEAKHKRTERTVLFPQNYRPVYEKYRGQAVTAIVDYVVDACTLRVEICPDSVDTERESNLMVRLAGVKSIDRMQRESDPQMNDYAQEAKEFVERALLDQTVKLKFVTCADETRNLYAQVIHPSGRRIAVALLGQGYAEYVQWVAKEIKDPTEIGEMRAAVQNARQERVRIWKHRTVTEEDDQGEWVTVVRVLSGDKLEVRYHEGNNAREIVRLSSIRAPTRFPDGKVEAFFRQAKEFTRAKTVGKQVLMHKDYEREQKMGDESKNQTYATIYVNNNENIAESLLRKGLAKLVQHPKDQDPSRDYIKLSEAADQAKKSHSYKLDDKPPEEPADFSGSPKTGGGRGGSQRGGGRGGGKRGGRGGSSKDERRRVALFTSLKNSNRRVKCVVEMVFSSTKFKLFVENSNAFITFQLAHIFCERAPPPQQRDRNYEPGRPTNNPGLDAIRLANDQLMQREVHIDVQETDPMTQTAKGMLYYDGGRDFAEELLEKGLASVFFRSGGRNQDSSRRPIQPPPSYLEIQEQARAAKLGGWSNEPSNDVEENDEIDRKVAFGEEIPVVISHIASATEFWVNKEEDSQKIDEVAIALEGYERTEPARVRQGKLYVGKYNGIWSRCEAVRKNQKRTDAVVWFVTFIDYGNRASLSEENLGKCPKNLADRERYPPLAFKCQLAGLRPPDPKVSQDYFNSSGEYFATLALGQAEVGKILKFKVLYDIASLSRFHRSQRQQRAKWGELFDKDVSLNKILVREGYVLLDSEENLKTLTDLEDQPTTDYVESIRRLRDSAFQSRSNIWRHGDIFADDRGEE